MSRAGRHIDMLPLLDVFMVVLFVFATVQEGTEKEHVEVVEQVEARAAQRLQAINLAIENETSKRKESERQIAALKRELLVLRAQQATPAETADGSDPSQDRILERLLEKTSVVEVEISGSFDEEGNLSHRCCFRSDPLNGTFAPCGGSVDTDEAALVRWMEQDASALTAALRKSGETPSLTLIKQDKVAAFRMAGKTAQAMRQLFPERQIYVEPDGPPTAACGAEP